jgi:hypothetical protein
LPKRRTTDFATVTVKATRNSTITVDRVIYSVPSRLIGRVIEVHLSTIGSNVFSGRTRSCAWRG